MRNKLLNNAILSDSFMKSYSQMYAKHMDDVTQMVNELLIDTAQKTGLDLYTICANYVPEIERDIEQIPIRGVSPFDKATMTIRTTIRLKYIGLEENQ